MEILLKHYALLDAQSRADAVNTLASRPAYALQMLNAVEAGKLPRSELSVFTVRQLLAFNRPEITREVERVWGTFENTLELADAFADAGIQEVELGVGGDGRGYDLGPLRELVQWRDARNRGQAA